MHANRWWRGKENLSQSIGMINRSINNSFLSFLFDAFRTISNHKTYFLFLERRRWNSSTWDVSSNSSLTSLSILTMGSVRKSPTCKSCRLVDRRDRWRVEVECRLTWRRVASIINHIFIGFDWYLSKWESSCICQRERISSIIIPMRERKKNAQRTKK